MLYRFKMSAKYPILISHHFMLKFGLKIGEHELIYIAEITLKRKYSVLKWRSNQILILRNNANLC